MTSINPPLIDDLTNHNHSVKADISYMSDDGIEYGIETVNSMMLELSLIKLKLSVPINIKPIEKRLKHLQCRLKELHKQEQRIKNYEVLATLSKEIARGSDALVYEFEPE